jgi:hypothetical protein
MKRASVAVRGIKITVPLQPESLPREGVPMEGPIGDIQWEIVLEGGALRLAARFNGKNYRRMLKTIDAQGGNVSVILQGSIKPTPAGQPLGIDSAGFQVIVKSPKSEASASAPADSAPSVDASKAAEPRVDEPAAPEPPGDKVQTQAAPAPLPGIALPGRRVYVPPAPVHRRRPSS